MRDRLPNEIEPAGAITAELPGVELPNKSVIDLDFQTKSRAIWLRIDLGQVHCVQQVVWYGEPAVIYQTWTCSEGGCAQCAGRDCENFQLQVSTSGLDSELNPIPPCYHGNYVVMENDGASPVSVLEIAVIGKEG